MQNENFDGILKLTKIQTSTWKSFCLVVARQDEREIEAIDAALESLAAEKKFLEFSGRVEERKEPRMRPAMLANARKERE